MSSTNGKSGIKSSFDAFSKVDNVVSKPVLGSDGAASWQEFRKDVKIQSKSVAPKAPLKKADRLGTGFRSWEEERAHEDTVRKTAGHANTGAGYTTFKKKNSAEEAAERKRIKRIESRIRPDDKKYYIPAETYQGSKFDYVFMTKPGHGTGYFWDGMDSIKQLKGEFEPPTETTEKRADSGETNDNEGDPKPKKKKRKKNAGPVIVSDPNNPMEQVAEILRKRNQQLVNDNEGLPPGWEATKDPTSNKSYFFNRSTGERSWTKPAPPAAVQDTATTELPDGWKAATDSSTGKTYFYNDSGETRWDKPTQ